MAQLAKLKQKEEPKPKTQVIIVPVMPPVVQLPPVVKVQPVVVPESPKIITKPLPPVI